MIAALTFSSCTGTIYDRMYSYQRNYYKPPKEKNTASAESLMGAMDKKQPDASALLDAAAPAANPAALPPADAGVPGLPPAGGPEAAAPGAPPAAGAPAIPGLPPATPPAPGTPPPPK
jgi:hypothetical protein